MRLERKMDDAIRFISKSERERARLIREARAIYESIFPSGNTLGGQPNAAPVTSSSYGRRPQCLFRRRGPSLMIKIVAVLCNLPFGKLPRGDRHHLGLC